MSYLSPELCIRPGRAFHVMLRAFEEQSHAANLYAARCSGGDVFSQLLEQLAEDYAHRALVSVIDRLSDEEQLDLIAMTWMGRGDFPPEQWDEARSAAREISREQTARYLAGFPLLGDYLSQALTQLGFRLTDYVSVH